MIESQIRICVYYPLQDEVYYTQTWYLFKVTHRVDHPHVTGVVTPWVTSVVDPLRINVRHPVTPDLTTRETSNETQSVTPTFRLVWVHVWYGRSLCL